MIYITKTFRPKKLLPTFLRAYEQKDGHLKGFLVGNFGRNPSELGFVRLEDFWILDLYNFARFILKIYNSDKVGSSDKYPLI